MAKEEPKQPINCQYTTSHLRYRLATLVDSLIVLKFSQAGDKTQPKVITEAEEAVMRVVSARAWGKGDSAAGPFVFTGQLQVDYALPFCGAVIKFLEYDPTKQDRAIVHFVGEVKPPLLVLMEVLSRKT